MADCSTANDKSELVSISANLPGGPVQGRPKLVATQVGFHPSTYLAAFSVGESGSEWFHSGSGSPELPTHVVRPVG